MTTEPESNTKYYVIIGGVVLVMLGLIGYMIKTTYSGVQHPTIDEEEIVEPAAQPTTTATTTTEQSNPSTVTDIASQFINGNFGSIFVMMMVLVLLVALLMGLWRSFRY